MVPRSVELLSPVIRLTYSADENRWNVESITGRGKGGGAPSGALQQGIAIENATLVVTDEKLFGSAGPRNYSGIYVRLTPDNTGVWHFEGSSLSGPLAGARFSGWYAPGKPPQINLTFNMAVLNVDKDLWGMLPAGSQVWKDFQPTGTMAVSGELSLDKDGRLLHTIDVQLRNATALPKYYPFPGHSVSGTVEVNNEGLVLKDITGIARAGDLGAAGDGLVNFRVSGTERFADGDHLYSIQASDVPLTQQVIEAIPEAGREVWQRLKPSTGTCQFSLTISRPAVRGARPLPRAGGRALGHAAPPGDTPAAAAR